MARKMGLLEFSQLTGEKVGDQAAKKVIVFEGMFTSLAKVTVKPAKALHRAHAEITFRHPLGWRINRLLAHYDQPIRVIIEFAQDELEGFDEMEDGDVDVDGE